MANVFKPVDNWKAVLTGAWSVRLIAISAVLNGLEAAFAYIGPILPISPGVLGVVGVTIAVLAGVARFIAQPELHK